MCVKAGAGGGEEIVEHGPQSQDRGARVHRPRDRRQGAHLAAWRAFFHQRHLEPGMGKPQGGGQTAHPRPDHHHPVHLRCHVVSVDLSRFTVQYDLHMSVTFV